MSYKPPYCEACNTWNGEHDPRCQHYRTTPKPPRPPKEPMSSIITVNGLRIETRENGTLFVNGKQYGPIDGTPAEALDSGDRNLILNKDGRIVGDVHGNLHVEPTKLFGSVTLVIEGNTGGSVTCAGNLTCNKVGGSADAGRDITVEMVGGSVRAGQDVRR